MITDVILVADKPRLFKFKINGLPACAIVTKPAHAQMHIVDVYCNDEHMTIHNAHEFWSPTNSPTSKVLDLPKPANIVIIRQ